MYLLLNYKLLLKKTCSTAKKFKKFHEKSLKNFFLVVCFFVVFNILPVSLDFKPTDAIYSLAGTLFFQI